MSRGVQEVLHQHRERVARTRGAKTTKPVYHRCLVEGKSPVCNLRLLEQYPAGAVVEVKGAADMRAADRNIAALAIDGVYRTNHHLAVVQGQTMPDRDPREVVSAHVRRLEALRRAGIVEREAEGVWRVPGDLSARGRQYDAQRLGGRAAAELKSPLPIERQARVIGATWLDQQLIGGGKGLGGLGFGAEVKDALRQRADFLVEQGLAEHRGKRVVLAQPAGDATRVRACAGREGHCYRNRPGASTGSRWAARSRHLPA